MSKRNLKPSGEGWVQLIAGIGFIVLLIVINIVDPTFYPTMWPVSYTHLDVYKRQDEGRG